MRSKRALAPSPALILLLVGVLRICANHEKNFPSFFEHCRQNASVEKLPQENEEGRLAFMSIDNYYMRPPNSYVETQALIED
jgi:hypothetical protein